MNTAPAVETNYRVKRVVHIVTIARWTACVVLTVLSLPRLKKCEVLVGNISAEAAATCIFV